MLQTDNKNAKVVLSVGSRNKELHQEAEAAYKLCNKYKINIKLMMHIYNTNIFICA